ncbi:MAG: ABC transporter permease [Armatimonadetes bacterium]|nr:ABC transporter permease [Armatimonadota bacterium]
MKNRAESGIFVALVVAMVAVAVLNPAAFFQTYSANLWLFSLSLIGLLAIGETFVILTGGIDLAPGSIIALAGVLDALLVQKLAPVMGDVPAVVLAIALTLAAGVGIGLYHSFYINRLGVPPFIITLGTLIIARGLAEYITHGSIISGLPEAFNAIGASGNAHVRFLPFLPVAGVLFVALAIVAHLIAHHTALGRRIYAVGGNVEAARLAGVNVEGVRAFCYSASAACAALAGVIIASGVTIGDPKAGVAYELTAIAAVVIGGISLTGGVGTILGAVIGAGLMSLLPLGLTFIGVESWWQSMSTGFVVVLAVTLDSVRRRRRERL